MFGALRRERERERAIAPGILDKKKKSSEFRMRIRNGFLRVVITRVSIRRVSATITRTDTLYDFF